MELEWDEAKRQKTLRERYLDFADVDRFDYDTVVTWPDNRRDYGRLGSIRMDILTACCAPIASHCAKVACG